MNVAIRVMPVAVVMLLTFGCESTPQGEATDEEVSELRRRDAECRSACQLVVACLRGGYGSYGGGYAECGRDESPDWCGYGGYGDGYGGYGNLSGYGDGYGGVGYGGCWNGYAECGRDESPDWCGYGGYGDGYGGYGNLPGYGDGYGGAGYGCGGGGGGQTMGQCMAGCQALPPKARHKIAKCVEKAPTCTARLACE